MSLFTFRLLSCLVLEFYIEADWSIFEFLNAASNRLNMVPAATRLFNADGGFGIDLFVLFSGLFKLFAYHSFPD